MDTEVKEKYPHSICKVLGGSRIFFRNTGHTQHRLRSSLERQTAIRLVEFITELGREDVDWTYLAQDRDNWWAMGYTTLKLRVLSNSGKFSDYLSNYLLFKNDSPAWSSR